MDQTLEDKLIEAQSAHLIKLSIDSKAALPHLNLVALDLYCVLSKPGADQAQVLIGEIAGLLAKGDSPVMNSFAVLAVAITLLTDMAEVFSDEARVKEEVGTMIREAFKMPSPTIN